MTSLKMFGFHFSFKMYHYQQIGHGGGFVVIEFLRALGLFVGTYLITHLNNFNLPLKGGYLISGSNQVGVFMIAFLWLKASKEYLP